MKTILTTLVGKVRNYLTPTMSLATESSTLARGYQERMEAKPADPSYPGSRTRGQGVARWLLRILTVAVAMPIGIACAQTVKVTPQGYVTADMGGTVQFTATVTGTTNTKVNWYAGGTLGGNATAGKISTTGLYTAPTTIPGQNPVEIRAVSQAKSTAKGITYVNILDPGPKITSVSPNPIPIGNVTVTIIGSGFKQYASVVDTSNGNPVQLNTTSITDTKIVADCYQPNAPTATFTVANPGSSISNAIVVPVSNGAQMYTLSVTNGTGGGSYAAGTVVNITANAPPAGQSFLNWTGATVANPNASTTTLTMPAANTTVTANYTASTKYVLTVNNGTGGGSYTAGTVVTITANAPPAGQAFSNWTGAAVANANSASTTITMPAAAATVTANYVTNTTKYVLTVNSGSGGGSYTSGTVVTITANTPPAGQSFTNWTGAAVANANSPTTTITMPSAAATVTANYSVAQQVPFPVTTHPRLWVTPADLPKLQSWAVATNPTYQQGMLPLLNTAVNIYQTQFFPNGVANPNYPDLGDTQGYQGQLTEEVGFVLAFNSLIDPVPANRIKYAQYARNLIMYALNQAALGVQAGAPFRDPAFPIYNRGDFSVGQYPLIVDWIYNTKDGQGNPILTSADKATIRKVFMIWANACLNASTTGGDHPEPIGTTNNFSLLNGGAGAYRMASNNYYMGHARLLTLLGLCIDPTDDPVLDGSKAPAALGNTLRSYILNANGAWLYQMYAMMGDPQQVKADYNLPANASVGLASGGLPPEGMLYGESYASILGQLLALQTAGFNDTALSGPQIKLIGSPVWDRFVTGYLSSLTPTPTTPASEPWLGPTYNLSVFGDVLRNWATPSLMQPFAFLGLLDQTQGKTSNLNAVRWFATKAVQGTPAYNESTPWTWGTAQSILYYLLLDPTAPAPTDPRPGFPLNFVDPAAGRVIAHSDWSSNPTWFDYRASWTSINHQHGDAGEFSFFRNGEWLTKELSNYDNNLVGFTTYYLNSLGLKNWCANGTPNLGWDEPGIWANGGQWMWGASAGDPVTLTSNGPGYSYAATDMTNLYNRPDQWTPANGAVDISQATRSILWLNKDYIVIYDRATSIHTGLPKTFNMSLATSPTIAGNAATETMADGQKLFVQSLLPTNATLTARLASGDVSPHSELDPMNYVLTVQDKTLPTDTRFLHVLQGSDPAGAMLQATYTKSATGTAFDGAVFGNSAVFFITNANATVGVTTFTVPSTVHTFAVAGLAVNSTFNVKATTVGNVTTVTLTPGVAGNISDAAGLLKVAI